MGVGLSWESGGPGVCGATPALTLTLQAHRKKTRPSGRVTSLRAASAGKSTKKLSVLAPGMPRGDKQRVCARDAWGCLAKELSALERDRVVNGEAPGRHGSGAPRALTAC